MKARSLLSFADFLPPGVWIVVLGAIASAKAMGVDSAKAATTAAQGALEGAKEAGSVTLERVLAALKEPIGGSKVALSDSAAK